MKDLLANKEGITISEETAFGSVKVRNQKTLTLWVRNVGSTPKTFCRCHMTAASTQMTVQEVKLLAEGGALKKKGSEVSDGKIVLYPNMSLYVNVSLDARYCSVTELQIRRGIEDNLNIFCLFLNQT